MKYHGGWKAYREDVLGYDCTPTEEMEAQNDSEWEWLASRNE